MCDDRDHRTYRLGVIVVAMAIRCSYGDSAYCRRTSIVLPWTGRRQRGVEATTNRSPGHRSLPQCGNERWSRWTIRRADTDTASVGVSYEPLTDAASLSAAAAHRRRRGRGERSCGRFRKHSDGTEPRRFLFQCLSAATVYDCTSSVRSVRNWYNRTRWFCAVRTYGLEKKDKNENRPRNGVKPYVW
jgi:hypothetical protein